MKQYDENQLRAIEAHDGFFLVLAPPGCGKTDILAERISRAVTRGISPQDMLCLTFTNRASRGMRSRIEEKVHVDVEGLFVGNVHRFCSRLLYANGVIPENTSIIDEDDQANIFCAYEPRFFSSSTGRINKNAVKYVGDLASFIKQSRLGHPDSVKYACDNCHRLYRIAEKYDFNPTLIPDEYSSLIYALQYLNYKEDRGIMDFEDILILAYDFLIHNEHRLYSWIQVDEVQDLNPLQLAIIDALTADEATAMYLGDEQQAIFSFMGAKLGLLSVLKNRCRGNILTLGNNYRSPDYLLRVCNDYAVNELGVDEELLPSAVEHTEKQKYDLVLTESDSYEIEQTRVLKMVNHYLKMGREERLAILVAKNDDADAISTTLSDAGVPNFKISGTDMFKTESYKTLSAFFSVLVNDFNFVAWSRLLYGIRAVGSLEAGRNVISSLKTHMMSPCDLLSDVPYVARFYERYSSGEEFVIFDTETTGLNVFEDEIVQIAAFKVRGLKKVEGSDFDILLETSRPIPERLGDIVNPLVERYASQPHCSRREGLKMFLDYIGGCPVLGHNVTYDYLILQHNIERDLGRRVHYDIFDSLHIIKCVAPGLKRYKLEYLVDHLDLAGRNSHLANEDIEATKSLVDYCLERIAPVLPKQGEFLEFAKVRRIREKMMMLVPLFSEIRSYLYAPVKLSGHNIATELTHMYDLLISRGVIVDLGAKFDTFLRYVRNEWLSDVTTVSLYDQLNAHIYDLTASLNEGDLVNSSELVQERVFIMTVYKGKGLEFDNVVILGANDGTYPFFAVNKVLSNPGSTPRERERALADRREDARKFYVALSRARKRLCVSYSKLSLRCYPTRMTPFMESIKHHFLFFRGR